MSEPSLVRASDIGLWAFCRRAWWLARVRHVAHQRPERLVRGQTAHAQHGATVQHAQWSLTLGWRLVAVGLIGAGLLLLVWVIQSLF